MIALRPRDGFDQGVKSRRILSSCKAAATGQLIFVANYSAFFSPAAAGTAGAAAASSRAGRPGSAQNKLERGKIIFHWVTPWKIPTTRAP
jgi:hypothetical protein